MWDTVESNFLPALISWKLDIKKQKPHNRHKPRKQVQKHEKEENSMMSLISPKVKGSIGIFFRNNVNQVKCIFIFIYRN